MTVEPLRIQLSRKRGFRLQAASLALNGLPAVRVTRPGAFGNAYRVEEGTAGWWWCMLDRDNGLHFPTREAASRQAVVLYAEKVEADASLKGLIVDQLRGHNVACTCPLEDSYGRRFPCHGDLLLELANG